MESQVVLTSPLITVAVPSLNQGRFLEEALGSISQQGLDIDIFVLDAGSQDNSLEVIEKWNNQLAGWRSHPDAGQAAAINEGISKGTAKYVCWLNSDDFFMPHGLEKLVHALEQNATAPAAYGKCWTVSKSSRKIIPYLTLPFNRLLLAQFCFIAQPATLIRR
ncbi:MAG: glycosyltransferase, partial [Ekhidna sp.]